jgi:hypothetical protein
METIKKEQQIILEYLKGNDRPDKNYFEGGVKDPIHTNELLMWVEEKEVYDEEKNDFIKNGEYQINICGSNRSLFELGRYLIALSQYETPNKNYHDHIEEIGSLENKKPCELIVHHPTRLQTE